MATRAGGSLEGPSGRSPGASSFFSSIFPSPETPPSEESICCCGVTFTLRLHLNQRRLSRSSSDQEERIKLIQAMNQEKE
ncbi:UNVERIFIED_CONTAM: hypothetical protein Slati_2883300 [Sesamum latifolium]|uniref:Uncharacterized protein n=1 Tax=Sesamum latifolium TaxID=2727402 RepID=A0AAW2VDS3_9LAMI